MASRPSRRESSAASRVSRAPADEAARAALEAAWIERASAGDSEAYRHLVECYQDQIYSVALRLLRNGETADEVAQDAFVRAWRALPRFEHRARFSTWIYRIVVNLCYDRLARKTGAIELALDDLLEVGQEPVAAPGSGAQDRLEDEEGEAAFGEALAALSDTYRVPFVLRQVEERSYPEIAAVLGITENNAKVRVHRAREMLVAWFRQQGLL